MIEKMKKCTFLIFHKDYEPFLYTLRNLGVVHVVEKKSGKMLENNDLTKSINTEKRLNAIVKSLKKIAEEQKTEDLKPADTLLDSLALLEKIEQLYADKDHSLHQKAALQKELDRMAPWGYFDLQTIEKLRNAGYYIHFHIVNESRFDKKWIDEYYSTRIAQVSSLVHFLTITNTPQPPEINAEQLKPFEKSVTALETELEAVENDIRSIDASLQTIAKNNLNTLIFKKKEIRDQINLQKVSLSSEATAGEKLMLLEGFIPEEKAEATAKALENEGVYFEMSNATPKENPPILLKNNRFAKLFEVISNLYDRPKYGSFDLTAFYAPFYVMFFGLCVGDCGYGLIYILLSFFLEKSKDTFMKSVSKLVLWLGIGTVIFGFLSGTFFGIPLLEQTWPWLNHFKSVIMDSDQLFYFALICGGVQITFAMIINVVTTWLRFGFLQSLNMVGWLITIWGNVAVFLLKKNGIIAPEMQMTCHYVVSIIGLCLMLFFNNPEKGLKGVFGSMGSGLFGLYNKISGLLGDMLSYIRLFALGISGSVMGLVFNQLAFSFAPEIPVVKQLVIVVILLIGHGINIFLCSLSGFVHPMRLTFVEFYNNAGFEGTGKPYVPFKKEAS